MGEHCRRNILGELSGNQQEERARTASPGSGVSVSAVLNLDGLLQAMPVDLTAVTEVLSKEPALAFHVLRQARESGNETLVDASRLTECVVLIGIEELRRTMRQLLAGKHR